MFKYIKTATGYQCPFCDYERELQSTVHMHIKIKHSECVKYKCEHCDYETPVKSTLENHIQNKHSEKAVLKEHSCPKCEHSCKTEAQLRSHYILKHLTTAFNKLFKTENDKISCTSCQRCFKSRSAFVYHSVGCLPEECSIYAADRIGLCLD